MEKIIDRCPKEANVFGDQNFGVKIPKIPFDRISIKDFRNTTETGHDKVYLPAKIYHQSQNPLSGVPL